MLTDKDLLAELNDGLLTLATKLKNDRSKSKKEKMVITHQAIEQLKRIKLSSLVKGEIAFIDLIQNENGMAWDIIFKDENHQRNRKCFYFARP